MSGPSSPRIDTHAHIFHRDLPTIPEARYVPDYAATLDKYLSVLSSNGMGRGVLVQPSFLGADNSYLLSALAAEPERLRGVIVVPAGNPTAHLALDCVAVLHAAGVRGVRLNLIGQPLVDLTSAAWLDAAGALAEYGWHLEIQAAGAQWIDLAPALQAWPAKLVIDHLGLPQASGDEASRAVLELAALDHIWFKVSAPYRSSVSRAEVMFNNLLEQGAADRLVFGSDWPFTRHEENTFEEVLAWAGGLAGEELALRMMTANPASLLGWHTPAGA